MNKNGRAYDPQARILGLLRSVMEPSKLPSTTTSNSVDHILDELGLRLEDDDHVKWKTDATAHPRNWSATRKSFNLGLVILLDLFTFVALCFKGLGLYANRHK
jgi:hypothetical protein